jgi:hypothetical protein
MVVSTTALVLIIVLAVLAFGTYPRWAYNRGWGYAPTGTLGTILLIVLLFALLGYL